VIHASVPRVALLTAGALALTAPTSNRTLPVYPMRVPQLGGPLREPPALVSSGHVLRVTIEAVRTANAQHSFAANGVDVAPALHVTPGDQLLVDYVDELPTHSRRHCSLGRCRNVTNLHFHGFGSSPRAPGDDVLDMLAQPGGGVLHYVVRVPPRQPPGLYWYHTHPHGESEQQVLDGMSGALVVDGIERYVRAVQGLREQLLVLRGVPIDPRSAIGASYAALVGTPPAICGLRKDEQLPERVFSVNGSLRPTIDAAPGERQFWRIVNAASDYFADLRYTNGAFEVVAMDGFPLVWRDPSHPTRTMQHVVLPPGGRVEAIVTAPPAGASAQLRSECVLTGPAGDPNPASVLADVAVHGEPLPPPKQGGPLARPPVPQPVDLSALERSQPAFTVTFTEDHDGFYINRRKFAMDAPPMARVKTGTYVHWRIVNDTDEVHPFHIHQVHFLAYATDRNANSFPLWLDDVNVPVRGSVDVILDATDPAIKGLSVFHCHLLNHEDKGMMAKVAFY
jgi:suppressor of ftsI